MRPTAPTPAPIPMPEPDVILVPEPAPAPDVIIIPAPTPEPRRMRVPSLIGLDRARARDVVASLGLRFSSRGVRSPAPLRRVVGQTPAAGSVVREGDAVSIRYSDGPGRTRMPYVLNGTKAAALDRIRAAGLTYRLSGPSSRPSWAFTTEVYRTDPVAGTAIDRGSRVRVWWRYKAVRITPPTPRPTPPGPIVIPRPSTPRVELMLTEVPSLVGVGWAEAERRLTRAGLRLGGTRPRNATIERISVVRTQSKPARTRVMRGTTITITMHVRLAPRR